MENLRTMLKKAHSRVGLLIILLFLLTPSLSIQGSEKKKKVELPSSVDAIVVLGNRPLEVSTPSVLMVSRVKKGVELLAQKHSQIIIFTGGRTAGHISEAEMMKIIAIALGADREKIILEEEALTTIGNALYVGKICKKHKWKEIILVTSPFHLPRATKNFKSQEFVVYPVASEK